MAGPGSVEIWQWGEYYCPWTYVAAVRLHAVMPEFRGRARLRIRPFPLELIDGTSAPRDILEQEWWLAAIQEPAAAFAPFSGDDWPTTTMPAFEGAWCAARQGDDALAAFDLRVRRAFFAEGRNIGRREVVRAVAEETGLDMAAFDRDVAGGAARPAVEDEAPGPGTLPGAGDADADAGGRDAATPPDRLPANGRPPGRRRGAASLLRRRLPRRHPRPGRASRGITVRLD